MFYLVWNLLQNFHENRLIIQDMHMYFVCFLNIMIILVDTDDDNDDPTSWDAGRLFNKPNYLNFISITKKTIQCSKDRRLKFSAVSQFVLRYKKAFENIEFYSKTGLLLFNRSLQTSYMQSDWFFFLLLFDAVLA